jgi:hypothetical protein
MTKIAIDWGDYDLKERVFEQALVEGKVTLKDHPLPNGRTLADANDHDVALAAKQFEQRGQDLLALAEWLEARRTSSTDLADSSKIDRLKEALGRVMQRA